MRGFKISLVLKVPCFGMKVRCLIRLNGAINALLVLSHVSRSVGHSGATGQRSSRDAQKLVITF